MVRPPLPGTSNPGEQERHLALDLIRGIAAASVAVYHWLYYSAGIPVQSMGTFSVYMFFVLSALAMALVYGPSFVDRLDYAAVAGFFRNRFARLFPLLALVAVVRFGLAGMSQESAVRALFTGSGAMAFGPPGFLSIGGGTWTLGIEIGFYLLVPVLLLWTGAVRLRTIILVALTLTMLQQAYLWLLAPIIDTQAHWNLYIAPLTFAPFFVAGLAIYKWGKAMTSPRWGILAIGLFVATMAYSLGTEADLFRSNGHFLALSVLAIATIFAAWRTRLPVALAGVARNMGDASYSLYLTHLFVLAAVSWLGLTGLIGFAVFAAASIATALLVFHAFERPARQWLRGPRSNS